MSSITLAQLVPIIEKFTITDTDVLEAEPNFEISRRRALTALRRLHQILESPFEASCRMGWIEPTVPAAVQIAVDQGFFKQLRDQPAGVTVREIAQATGQPLGLVQRALRHLSANNIVKQKFHDTFIATAKSNAFLDSTVFSGIKMGKVWHEAILNLPYYVGTANLESRDTPAKGNFEHIFDLPIFEWLQARPDLLESFMLHMDCINRTQAEWIDVYPIQDQLLADLNDTGPVVVDVGGGTGRSVQSFVNKFPQHAGRVYLQDLDHVLKMAHTDQSIQLWPHDFFTPQPVRDARVYLLEFILHDWTDKDCLKILAQLIPAMRAEYSLLIVYDVMIYPNDPNPTSTALDLSMLSMTGSRERTEDDWRGLLGKAGLRVTAIYTPPESQLSVIECMLPLKKIDDQ